MLLTEHIAAPNKLRVLPGKKKGRKDIGWAISNVGPSQGSY